MMPAFDFTGIVDFGELQPTQAYDYQIGYFFADGEPGDHKIDENDDWSRAAKGSFTTANSEANSPCSFVFGSCRYILRLLGISMFDERGDKTFRSINRQIENGVQTDFFLMVGDQIYADDLGPISPDKRPAEFFARYRTAFGQEHLRKLMSRVPTYMVMDDHEIGNNWHQDRRHKEADLYAAAIHAYECYQFVHGPGFEHLKRPQRSDTPEKLWFTFGHGEAQFFVMDTRTERFPSFDPPLIIGGQQMVALKNWLAASGDAIKFVVTSVPFFPDTRSESSDKWSGFERQRLDILDFIASRKVSKVVFLSGDVHCSMAGQLMCPGSQGLRITSVISSSFFWPYPQSQASQFKVSGTLCKGKGGEYKLANFTKLYCDDNFTRVTSGGDSLLLQVYERKGALLGSSKLPL